MSALTPPTSVFKSMPTAHLKIPEGNRIQSHVPRLRKAYQIRRRQRAVKPEPLHGEAEKSEHVATVRGQQAVHGAVIGRYVREYVPCRQALRSRRLTILVAGRYGAVAQHHRHRDNSRLT